MYINAWLAPGLSPAHARPTPRKHKMLYSQSMEGPFGILLGLLGGCLGTVWGLFGGCWPFVGRFMTVRYVVEHFLLFCFAWHAHDIAYSVFFSLFLSTVCYFAMPGMHATWPTAFLSRCFWALFILFTRNTSTIYTICSHYLHYLHYSLAFFTLFCTINLH